jgi:hypothetical protein
MTDWIFNDVELKTLEDFPINCFGFVYKITNITKNKTYVGKKFLYHIIKKKIGSKTKRIKRESDWKKYCGSNEELKIDISTGDIIKREILHLCNFEKQLTYYELKYLFINEVLEKDNYYNNNINGKFYRKDI